MLVHHYFNWHSSFVQFVNCCGHLVSSTFFRCPNFNVNFWYCWPFFDKIYFFVDFKYMIVQLSLDSWHSKEKVVRNILNFKYLNCIHFNLWWTFNLKGSPQTFVLYIWPFSWGLHSIALGILRNIHRGLYILLKMACIFLSQAGFVTESSLEWMIELHSH